MSIHVRTSRAIVLLTMVALAMAGCVSSSLQAIHDNYRSEFQSQLGRVSAITKAEQGAASLKAEQFPVTLAAIAKFRQDYPNQDDANKHITVLEAMIYLQTQRYGHARLAASVAGGMQGASLNTYGGGLTRDELFLQALLVNPGMIDAWEILLPGDTLQDGDEELYRQTADSLAKIAMADADNVPAGDGGRAYIAATAALMRMKEMDYRIVLEKSKLKKPNPDKDAINKEVIRLKQEYGKKIEELMKPHLTPIELGAADNDAQELSEWAIRYRYVRIYKIGQHLRMATE
ncbi:hypothetical protein HED60_13900 [Planctomycetales bacterium ZRK34]|nr:hypothetical protein HED60_13900 [Planctomycetales bacterium ZRK34]